MVVRLVRAALTHRTVVFLCATALLGAGLWAAATAPLDVFPEFAPPIVEIQTEAPGLAAADVEALVTTPLERALAGSPGIATFRSSSAPGLSVLTVLFPYGTDPYRARQLVSERLALAAELLPAGVKPAVAPLTAALTTILAIGLRAGPGISPLALRDLADWTLRPRLLAVPGVANVVVFGGDVRQIQLTTTPERLWAVGATVDDLGAAVAAADAASGSGFVDRSGQRLPLWLDARLHRSEDIARAPLPGRSGVPVALATVADVGEGPAVAVGDGVVNGDPGVVLAVTRQPDVNVMAVTAAVEAALGALVPALPPGVRVERAMFRQATFVTHALGNLRRALVAGGVLVAVVLLLFLGNLRAAAVSVLAIPLSLLAAVTVLRAAGATLNVMVLGGLAIAVGEVVDDAIIDVENAWWRLRAAPPDAPRRDIVLAASVEVRSAVVYATLMVALVFLPVFLLGGLEGALFRPLATAYVLATLASLGVALTVTPALVLALLPGAAAATRRTPRLLTALRTRYERALGRTLARPRTVVVGSALALLAGADDRALDALRGHVGRRAQRGARPARSRRRCRPRHRGHPRPRRGHRRVRVRHQAVLERAHRGAARRDGRGPRGEGPRRRPRGGRAGGARHRCARAAGAGGDRRAGARGAHRPGGAHPAAARRAFAARRAGGSGGTRAAQRLWRAPGRPARRGRAAGGHRRAARERRHGRPG